MNEESKSKRCGCRGCQYVAKGGKRIQAFARMQEVVEQLVEAGEEWLEDNRRAGTRKPKLMFDEGLYWEARAALEVVKQSSGGEDATNLDELEVAASAKESGEIKVPVGMSGMTYERAPTNVCVAMREAYMLAQGAEGQAYIQMAVSSMSEALWKEAVERAWRMVQVRRAVRKAMDAMGMPRS